MYSRRAPDASKNRIALNRLAQGYLRGPLALSTDHHELADDSRESPVERLDAVEIDAARDALPVARDEVPGERSVAARAVVVKGLNEIPGDGINAHVILAPGQIAELELLAGRIGVGRTEEPRFHVPRGDGVRHDVHVVFPKLRRTLRG